MIPADISRKWWSGPKTGAHGTIQTRPTEIREDAANVDWQPLRGVRSTLLEPLLDAEFAPARDFATSRLTARRRRTPNHRPFAFAAATQLAAHFPGFMPALDLEIGAERQPVRGRPVFGSSRTNIATTTRFFPRLPRRSAATSTLGSRRPSPAGRTHTPLSMIVSAI
jgi:hypothetical protein